MRLLVRHCLGGCAAAGVISRIDGGSSLRRVSAPGHGPQAGVSELALNFDYNTSQTQWLLLAPGLINNTHLGLYRNYFGQDIDDVFIAAAPVHARGHRPARLQLPGR